MAGVDELNMCTMRLRLRIPEDKVDNQDNWFLQVFFYNTQQY